MRVLVVEDDPAQSQAVEKSLQGFGHEITEVNSGEKAIRFLKSDSADLVILDWQLPKMSGFDVLHWIRAQMGADLPVLFLTSKALEIDIVRALEAGADDYVVKPYRTAEFVARVNAALRRVKQDLRTNSIVQAGNYAVDSNERTVQLSGEKIALTPKEFDLVALLFNNPGRIISRDLMATAVWGHGFDAASRTLDTHMYRIRQKLTFDRTDGVRLSAVYTHGYRLDVISQSKTAANSSL
jgi:DNA-binding response OmpR family regulator